MKRNLLKEIEERMSGFSKGQKLISNYILDNYDKAAYMTASKLGSIVHVSESTVVRFANELGFEGYPEFQHALQEIVRTKLTSFQRMEVTNNLIGDGDILAKVLMSDSDKIKRTLDDINRDDFNAAVENIASAKKIYVLGARSAATLAGFLAHSLHMISDDVIQVQTSSGSEMFEQLMSLSTEDTVIAVSFPRYSKKIINAVDFAKHSGANVYRSIDQGKTFEFLGGCQNIVARNYDEHIVYEKKNGVLVMYTRTNYGVARSLSYDRGKTWTVGEDSGIKSPCTKNFVCRLKSGRLLYVGHYEYTGRNNLTAFLSDDDGETWSHRILLDERDYVSYPDAVEGDDGSIYIIYDRARGAFHNTLAKAENSAREVLMAKLREEDIIAGEIVSEGSFMKHIVSKLGKYTGERDLFNHTFTTDLITRIDDGTVRDYYNDIRELNIDEMLKRFDTPADALSYVFDAYPVRCDAIACLDSKKLNAITDKIEKGEGDVRESFESLVELLANTNCEAARISYTPIVNRVIERIQSSVKENISLADLAEELGISVYYMCHLFKRRTGMSIIQYRDEYRLMLAKQMLVMSELPVSVICDECGFSDASYFSSKFREVMGVTPSAYRKANKR